MKSAILWATLALAGSSLLQPAAAIGCLSGGLAGGVAGHYAGHHPILGAAGGCIAGHYANRYQQRRAANAATMRSSQQGYGGSTAPYSSR